MNISSSDFEMTNGTETELSPEQQVELDEGKYPKPDTSDMPDISDTSNVKLLCSTSRKAIASSTVGSGW